MKFPHYPFYAFFILGFFLGVSLGETPEVEKIFHQVELKMEKIENIEAQITQKTYSPLTEEEDQISGILYYQPPDLMRINYTLPREEIFFLQKGTCWLYLKEHNYVIKRKLGNDLKEQFFFPNLRKMAQTYQVSLKGRTKDFFHLEFSPYPGKEQNFTKIEIFLNRKLFLPEKIVICDLFGNLTTLHLRKFKINRKIKEEIFNWQPPAEAEVVEP